MATTLPKPNMSNGFLVQSESSPNADAALSDGVARDLVRWFKLLADETRLRILFFLLETRELNVRTLCDMLELSQPAVSHHLALLRVDGLIECRRDGKHNYYHILPQRFSDLMGKIVAAVPAKESQRRLGDISLLFSPASDAAANVPPTDVRDATEIRH